MVEERDDTILNSKMHLCSSVRVNGQGIVSAKAEVTETQCWGLNECLSCAGRKVGL